ncbi:EamA family transporter [Gracilibacillus massiliensis]|uniref:EamA family transporter n=1 Tax=Gracilibacillus massiliensis TaxID=1564956 RepID=UPI00071E53B5|nr:EamA family transporter [Gracilibacillus massiliensis]
MKNYLAYLFTVIGASFWGLTGLFVEAFYAQGFSAWEIVAIRLSASSIILVSTLLFLAPKQLIIKLKHIPHFFGLGVLGIVFFN